MGQRSMSGKFWHQDARNYERFQPQGRGHNCTGRQDGGRNSGAGGKGSRGIHQVLERRSGAGGADAFDQSAADRGGQDARTRQLHGETLGSAQVKCPVSVLVALGVVACALIFLAGCGHKPMQVSVPPAPSVEQPSEESSAAKPSKASGETLEVPLNTKPLLVETGIASWYGAPYHNRRGSNGEIYDMHGMTAAHRTLPLGSVVRVTCIENGSSAVVRITDRGPFIEGRVIDLSRAAAEKIGLVQKGTTKVRLEVLKTPQPIEVGGRWAVQIGGFQTEDSARDFADHLTRRYHTAKVLTFPSPAGDWWVRVRVKDDERERAEEVMRAEKTSEGGIFLVRLD